MLPTLKQYTLAVIFVRYYIRIKMGTLNVKIHLAEEGGYWAEVPELPGCVTQAETLDELIRNVYEAIEGCMMADL